MNPTKSLLHESPAALARIAEQVEELTGIPAGHVEKDFWVTEVLRSIASYGARHNVDVIFKGGTSLSKAFRLIKRFSEDVDILVALTDRSAPEVADHMAAIIEAAATDTGLHAITHTSAKPSDIKRAATLAFSATNPPGGTRDGVLLELGTRGGTQPMERLQIRSLVAEHAQTHGIDIGDYADIPFAIHVMRPVRTLIEKLMIVHHAAQSNDTDEQQRHARPGHRARSRDLHPRRRRTDKPSHRERIRGLNSVRTRSNGCDQLRIRHLRAPTVRLARSAEADARRVP